MPMSAIAYSSPAIVTSPKRARVVTVWSGSKVVCALGRPSAP
jgi:hypothetical protein